MTSHLGRRLISDQKLILPLVNIGFSFALACDLNGRPYPYCLGHISMVNIETSSYVVLSHWDQGNIHFYGMPEN